MLLRGLQRLWTFKQRLIEQRYIRLTLAVGSCKTGLRSLAALITAMLLVSASPSGALASHSSIVKVDLGCGGRILRTGVLERLAAMNAATWAGQTNGSDNEPKRSYLISHCHVFVTVFSYRASNIEWTHTHHRSACFPRRLSLASAIVRLCKELFRRKMRHHFNISGRHKVEGHLITFGKRLL
jgi:hypothetical protein